VIEAKITLVQSSPTTRSWLQGLRHRLPSFEYSEVKYYAAFRSASDHRVLAYLNPAKRSIRVFLPLAFGDAPHLQPTPSTSSWAERFPSVFRIAGEQALSTEARLIAKSSAGMIAHKGHVEIGPSGIFIHVESQDLNDEVIDRTIRENRLRMGIVPTDSAVALARQRRGQERLRRLTLLNYDSMCALCDVDELSLLIASHIVGWAEAPEACGMLSNVICLCQFHDVLFEQGYWSLADDFTLLRTSQLKSRTIARLLDGALPFRRPYDHPPASSFLRQHRLRWGLEMP
jgi:HNH endonuclease